MSDETEVTANLDEMRSLIRAFPGPDEAARNAVAEREAQLTKPPGALGRLEELTAWIAGWQAKAPPKLDRPRVCVFAGNHG
ncbi:MAG: nicotinate-nucleotide--dimethylbenzimidazole phosphoribosyltransferase, partial [Rhodospirillales bacterium]